jgi:hypothetical protein
MECQENKLTLRSHRDYRRETRGAFSTRKASKVPVLSWQDLRGLTDENRAAAPSENES